MCSDWTMQSGDDAEKNNADAASTGPRIAFEVYDDWKLLLPVIGTLSFLTGPSVFPLAASRLKKIHFLPS
jgi:hypothetical protein